MTNQYIKDSTIKRFAWLKLTPILFSISIAENQSKIEPPLGMDDRGYIVKVGDFSPDFDLEFPDGSTSSFEQLRGSVIMLQFTASWCSVCRTEMPHIEKEIWKPYKKAGLKLIGIDLDEPADIVTRFAKKMKISYPLALDIGAKIFHKFAAESAGVTRNIIINPEGQIVFLTRLYDPVEFKEMIRVIHYQLTKKNKSEIKEMENEIAGLESAVRSSGKSLKYSYQLNDIPREPIIAPFTFPILKSEEKFKMDLEEALRLEPFVFKRNTELVQKWTNSLENFFLLSEDIRKTKDKYLQSKDLVYRYRHDENYNIVLRDFKADSIELSQLNLDIENKYSISIKEIPWVSFLDAEYQTGPQYDLNEFEKTIIQICSNRWAEGIYDIPRKNIISDKTMIHQGKVPVLANTDEYHDLESAWIRAKQELTQSYAKPDEAQHTTGYFLIVEFMKPNLIYDKEVTKRRQQSRLDRVSRFQGTILKDERIVDANERISEEVLLTLESLATAIDEIKRKKTGLKNSTDTYEKKRLLMQLKHELRTLNRLQFYLNGHKPD